jgi:hypothetical protein
MHGYSRRGASRSMRWYIGSEKCGTPVEYLVIEIFKRSGALYASFR